MNVRSYIAAKICSSNQCVSTHTPSRPSAIRPDTHSPVKCGRGSQWKWPFPIRSFLGLGQPIRKSSLVHLTLFLAGDSQSQRLQHTWCIVVWLLVVCRLTLVWTPAQVPWIQAIIPTASLSDALFHYHAHVAWQTLNACVLSCVCKCVCVLACTCASEELGYLIPTMLCCLISRPLSLSSWLHHHIETQQ